MVNNDDETFVGWEFSFFGFILSVILSSYVYLLRPLLLEYILDQ